MKAHIVLAHPESQSFNGRLADVSRSTLEAEGWTVTLSDLYTDGFDPREDRAHYDQLSNSEVFHAQTEQRFNAAQGTTPQIIPFNRDSDFGDDKRLKPDAPVYSPFVSHKSNPPWRSQE